MSLTFGSLFAGIGGFDIGLVKAGFCPLWYAEIDERCSKLMSERAPGITNLGDVRNVKKETVEPVDVVVGGFPCQDLSVAGKRAGLAGSRSGLWYEFHRVLAELRPQWAIIENVPGLLSSNGGRDFATILSGLAQIGYCTAWRVLDAQYYGVAQRRRRVFIVASLGSGRCAQVLFERESLSWDPAPGREAGTFTSALTTNGVGVRGADDNQAQARHLISSPLTSHAGRNAEEDNYIVGALPAHSARHGHAMTTQQAAESGQLIAQSQYGDVAGTLSARHDSSPCADRGQNVIAYQCHGNNVGPMGTLREGNGGLTGGVPFVFQPRYFTRDNKTGGAPSEAADITNVHKAGDSAPVVAFNARRTVAAPSEEQSPTLSAGSGGFQAPGVSGQFGVRRLTPTECERLQGFPDGWTDNGQSDSARYRQLGNAVCVPVAEWIGHQLIRAISLDVDG